MIDKINISIQVINGNSIIKDIMDISVYGIEDMPVYGEICLMMLTYSTIHDDSLDSYTCTFADILG